MITLLVMTDGRADCLARSIASLNTRLHGPITRRVIHADGNDPAFIAHLYATYAPDCWQIVSTGTRSGFAGAYRSAWDYLRKAGTTPWVFSTEDDFTLNVDVDLADLINVMDSHRQLAQMALLRQPWSRAEQVAGGIVAQHPDDYLDRTDGQHHWLQHRRFFTTNPHLLRREFIATHDWPAGEQSEGRFGLNLFADEPQTACAFWGRRNDPPRVEHIGAERVGTGY